MSCTCYLIIRIKSTIWMSRNKQIAFKNPFDLIEEEEQPINMPSQRTQGYTPPSHSTHSPLPFNPYQISKEQPVAKIEKKPQVKQPASYQPKQQAPQFASPFGESPKTEYSTEYQSSAEPSSQTKIPQQYELDQNGDPPLLVDIGIQPEKIKERIFLILKLGQPSQDIIHDPDLSGPIAIALTLGCLLLFAGKIHFGNIYAMFIFGNLLVYFLLNFISQAEIVPLYSIMSTMGYGLLPMLGLGFIGVFFALKGGFGILVGLASALWASIAAGNFMDALIKDAKNRKALVIYPLFLFYVSFTMIVIF